MDAIFLQIHNDIHSEQLGQEEVGRIHSSNALYTMEPQTIISSIVSKKA